MTCALRPGDLGDLAGVGHVRALDLQESAVYPDLCFMSLGAFAIKKAHIQAQAGGLCGAHDGRLQLRLQSQVKPKKITSSIAHSLIGPVLRTREQGIQTGSGANMHGL